MPLLSIVEKNGWIYIIRFKEGSIPSVYKEFQNLLQISPENKRYLSTINHQPSTIVR
ncbi:MAG: hypothetical protein AB1422_17120 [bacterium]